MESAVTAVSYAQALLDPTGQGLFPTAKLIPYLNLAYQQLRIEGVSQRQITFSENLTVIPAFPVGVTDLGKYIAPGGSLAALIAPVSIFEKPAGTSDANYMPVKMVTELPNRDAENFLSQFEWRGGNIFFVGALQALDLKIRYDQIWPAIKDPSDPLGATDVAVILGYWTAGLMAAAMREQQLSVGYVAEAKHVLYRWMQGQIMDMQNQSIRPRPFRNGDRDRHNLMGGDFLL